MRIDAFVLCSSAQSFGKGQFSINEEIKEIAVAKLPTQSRQLTLAIGISFASDELIRHDIRFSIKDVSGGEVYDTYGFDFGAVADPSSPWSSPAFIIDRVVLKLSQVGKHQASLHVDGKKMAEWNFQVKLLQ